MPDLETWCKTCEKQTGHTHIKGNIAVCAECGETNKVPNAAKVQSDIEKRRKVSIDAVERNNGLKLDSREPSLAPAETKKRSINVMARKGKLDAEDKLDIIDRCNGGEKQRAVAKDYSIKPNAVWYICKNAKPKILALDPILQIPEEGDAGLPGEQEVPGPSPLKLAIEVAVSGHMAMIRQQIVTIVRDEIGRMLK